MPRKKIEVDRDTLQNTISTVESGTKFRTRNDLAIAVGESMGISPSVVLLRIKEFNLEPKTPKGKRGRQPGVKLSKEHKQAMQAGRKGKVITNGPELKQYFPESRHGLIDKVVSGSLAAAVKANCLSCAGMQTQEIKHCNIKTCVWWCHRPYQENK